MQNNLNMKLAESCVFGGHSRLRRSRMAPSLSRSCMTGAKGIPLWQSGFSGAKHAVDALRQGP